MDSFYASFKALFVLYKLNSTRIQRTAVLLTVFKKSSKSGFGLIMAEDCDFCILTNILFLWFLCLWRRLQQAEEVIL